MKQLLKNLVMIAIAVSTAALISCGDDEPDIPPPVASFIPTINQETGVVTFENTSSEATSYSWDFGDGSDLSSLENPTHTYEPGMYTVELTASNDAGDSDVFTDDITINDVNAPVITLAEDGPICLSVGDTFTDPGATATDDVDGDVSSNIVVDASAVDTETPGEYEVTYNVSDSEGNAATVAVLGVVVSEVFSVEGNLLSNGDFSNGATGWIANYEGGPGVREEGCSSFFYAEITSPAPGQAFLVNVSQVVEIVTGATYTLQFDASSDRARTIIAGIGLNEEPFTLTTETVNLTTDFQTFTLEGLVAGFGGANSRALFDLAEEAGVVVIDNVSLVKTADAPEPGKGACTGELVAATSLPLDFEGCEIFDLETNFGALLFSELAANPSKTGINTSDYVFKVDKPTGADFFAGVQNTFASNFDLTTTNTFKFKVYSTKANAVIRFELALDPNPAPAIGNPAPVFKTITNANEWTEVEVQFINLPATPTSYNRLVIKPDNDQSDSPITEGGTYYFDDITLVEGTTGGGGPTEPTVSAPVPTVAEADVISIFSDAYTDLAGINYNPNWSQSGFNDVNTTFDPGDGNVALAYPNFNYQGTDLGGNQDFSAMNTLHIDIWVAAGTDRQVKVSPISDIGVVEVLVPVTLTPGSWSSVDIPIGDFTGMTWDAIKEIKFDGQFNGDGTANTAPFDIYLDNIYFYNDPNAGGGGGTPGAELTTNGDFETGDATGWTSFATENNGTFTVTTAQAQAGTYSGLLKADVDGGTGGASFPLVKQANIGTGTVTAGATVTVSFDLYGSLSGAGGVVFAELFSELATEGVSKTEILGGGSIPPTGTWTNHSFTTTLGNDVGGGITLQLKADCGANAGCIVEAYFDNVSVKVIE